MSNSITELCQTDERKALYLMSQRNIYVTGDHNRIIIEQQDKTPRYFPYGRINRIISGANTHWHGLAIAYCLKQQVSIIWLDHKQQPIGDSQPLHRITSNLHQSIEMFLELPDWQERHENWLRKQYMQRIASVRRRKITTQAEFETQKRTIIYQQKRADSCAAEVQTFFQSIISQALNQRKTRATYWGFNGQAFEISNDLTEILCTEFLLEKKEIYANEGKPIQQLEQWWQNKESNLMNMLSSLHKHLNSETDQWL